MKKKWAAGERGRMESSEMAMHRKSDQLRCRGRTRLKIELVMMLESTSFFL